MCVRRRAWRGHVRVRKCPSAGKCPSHAHRPRTHVQPLLVLRDLGLALLLVGSEVLHGELWKLGALWCDAWRTRLITRSSYVVGSLNASRVWPRVFVELGDWTRAKVPLRLFAASFRSVSGTLLTATVDSARSAVTQHPPQPPGACVTTSSCVCALAVPPHPLALRSPPRPPRAPPRPPSLAEPASAPR